MLKNLEKGGMIMSISLQKGQKVNLSKEKKGLSRVVVGLGWDEVKRSRGFFATETGTDRLRCFCNLTAERQNGRKR